LDEVPTCAECDHPLKPKAKFCGECGVSTEPKPEEPPAEDTIECPECGEELPATAKFCGECGHKMGVGAKQPVKTEKKPVEADKKVKLPPKREEKPKEKTVKLPDPEPEEEEVEEEAESFDFNEIDPEKEWECFGQIEPDHTECKGCSFREKCAEKSGVEL